jgi:hypothetical protein
VLDTYRKKINSMKNKTRDINKDITKSNNILTNMKNVNHCVSFLNLFNNVYHDYTSHV